MPPPEKNRAFLRLMRFWLGALALAFLLEGCASAPTPIPRGHQGYKGLSVAILEPSPNPHPDIFEEMVSVLVPHFGRVSIAKSAEEAKADLVVTLAIDSRPATTFFGGTALMNVHATLAAKDGMIVERIMAHGRQKGRPPLMLADLNERARRLARQDLEGRLLSSPKLAEFARGLGKGAPAPPEVSDVDRPGYRLPEDQNRFALVIGIEKYAALPEAPFAERDAEAVREHLAALGTPRRNIVHLSGKEALRSAMEKYLESWLPRNVSAESRVFVYFSGHGAPEPKTSQAYLVPWDGDAKYLENTAYPLRRLYERLADLKAKEVVVVLDTCFSGAGGRSVLARGTRPLVTRIETGPQASGKLLVLSASAADEITGTQEAQGHGLFTYFLLKGLAERKGRATAKELFEYLRPRVQEEARRDNRDQTPQLLPADSALQGLPLGQ